MILFHPTAKAKQLYDEHKRTCWNCSCDVEIVADLCPEGRDLWSLWRYGRKFADLKSLNP
jgi:hypothetical protein